MRLIGSLLAFGFYAVTVAGASAQTTVPPVQVCVQNPPGSPVCAAANVGAGPRGNSILHGIGPPVITVGTNGDFYLDTAAQYLYGPKVAGAWPTLGVRIIGAQGPPGAPGAAGPQGPVGPAGGSGSGEFSFVIPWQQLSPANGMVIWQAFKAQTIDAITGFVTVPETGAAVVDVFKNGCSGAAMHLGDFRASTAAGPQKMTLVSSPTLAAGDTLNLCTRGFPTDPTKMVGNSSIVVSGH